MQVAYIIHTYMQLLYSTDMRTGEVLASFTTVSGETRSIDHAVIIKMTLHAEILSCNRLPVTNKFSHHTKTCQWVVETRVNAQDNVGKLAWTSPVRVRTCMQA